MENKRSIVVVEALSNGRYYIPEIEKRGYEPVVVLVPNENGAFPPAYEHFRQDTVATYYQNIACFFPQTIEEACEMLAGRDIVAVVSGSDYGTSWTDALAERFNCPGNGSATSALRFLKPEMQEALHEVGLRSIKGKAVGSLNEIFAFFEETGSRKIVLKYKASAGSVGVHFCSSVEQIEEAYSVMCSGTDFFGRNNDEILVQEYISGTEYIVNTVSCNGVHRVTDIWVCDKERVGAEGNAYNYYKVVTKPGIKHMRLIEYAYATLDALGFRYGPSHGEYFIDDRGPVLVEVGARPMGGGFSPDLYLEALGHCLVDASLDSYLDPSAFDASRKAGYAPKKEFMIKYLIAPEHQRVNSLPVLPLLKLMPSVRKGNFVHCIEDAHIVKTIDLITAPAYIHLVHENKAVLQYDYHLIKRLEKHFFDVLLSSSEPELTKTDAPMNETEEWKSFAQQEAEQEGSMLVVLDPGVQPSGESNGSVVFLSVDNLFEHTEKYNHIVLAFKSVQDLEIYFDTIIRAAALLKEGGELSFRPETVACVPNGEDLLDIVMEIMGMPVVLPSRGARERGGDLCTFKIIPPTITE